MQMSLLTHMERRLAEQKSTFELEIACLWRTTTDLKKSVDFLVAENEDLKSATSTSSQCSQESGSEAAGQASSDIETRVKLLEKELGVEHKLDYIEDQSCRNNLRIEGLPEIPGETWDMTEQVCQDFFTHRLDLSALEIERAYCTGGSIDGRPCTIIVKLLSYKDREAILNRSKDRKIPGVFINQDFSNRVAKIH